MSEDKNLLGGGNSRGLYMPMSDLEQLVIDRMIESQDFALKTVVWGVGRTSPVRIGGGMVETPHVYAAGDKRVAFAWRQKIAISGAACFLDVFLSHSGSNTLLIQKRMPLLYADQPVPVQEGETLPLSFEVAVSHMDPKFVKKILPMARGLTSYLQDKDSKEFTRHGNMKMTDEKRRALAQLEKQADALRKLDIENVSKAVKAAVGGTGGDS